MTRQTKKRARRPSALSLIAICFLGSVAVRMGEHGTAIAEEMAARQQDAHAQEASASESGMCPPPLEPATLLANIRERQSQLDAREKDVSEKEQLLKVSQLRIEEQIAKLEAAEAKLRETISLADGAAESDINRLTAVYENMKPALAAQIFETMDVNFAAEFLIRMRPDVAGNILTGMQPDLAYAISVVMAGRNANVPR